MLGFKTIDEFTYDDCMLYIRSREESGEDVERAIKKRFSQLQSELDELDERLFSEAHDLRSLNKYVETFTAPYGALHYDPKHLCEVIERINDLKARTRKRLKRRMWLCSGLLVALLVGFIWIGYEPAAEFYIIASEITIPAKGTDGTICLGEISNDRNISIVTRYNQDIWNIFFENGSIYLEAKPNSGKEEDIRLWLCSFPTVWGKKIGYFRNEERIRIGQESGRGTYLNVPEKIVHNGQSDNLYISVKTDGVWELTELPDDIGGWCSARADGDSVRMYLKFNDTPLTRTADLKVSINGGEISKRIKVIQNSSANFNVSFSTESADIEHENGFSYLRVRKEVEFNHLEGVELRIDITLLDKNDKEITRQWISYTPKSDRDKHILTFSFDAKSINRLAAGSAYGIFEVKMCKYGNKNIYNGQVPTLMTWDKESPKYEYKAWMFSTK